ncbi:MAG: HAMP domain-containing histidine kinase, partial [Flavobacteriaceae bacterium]|nr:HAMP domain-containing histidine kinase [Flavobacteriaceae bacterium]
MRKYTLVVLSCFLITSAFGDVIENKLDFQKLFQSKDVLSSQIIIYNHYSGIQGVDDKIQFSENLLQEAIRLDANEFMDLAHFFLGQSLIVKKDWDKASFNYHQILKRSQKKLIGLTGLVNFFNKRNQLDSLNHYLNEAEREYEKTDNEFLKSIYLRRLGLYKIEKEKYLEALDNLTIVSETPVIKDSAIGTICLFNIGYMYEHLNYPEQARIYYKKALINSRNNNTPNLSHFIKFKLSHINLFNFDNVDEALKGYKELEPIYTSSNKVHEGILYGTMGFAYLQKGNEDDAFKYMIKSRDYFERRKDSTFLCLPYTYLTHYYVAKQQYDKAIENGERAKKIIEDKNLFDARKLILLDKIAEAYFAIGKYDKSNGLLNELNNIKTKLEIKKNTVAFTDNQYERRISEEKLNVANLKYQISEKNKLLYIFLLSALGITLLFTSILYHNRKKTADKLKELDTAKSKFFANISHEFRTPLTLINNPIEAALADETLPEKKREQFDVAKRNSDRLLSLVNQLLDLSKIDAGQLKLRIQQGNVNQLIAALADSFAYSAKQKDIEFNVALDHNESVDYFDKDAVEKIVVNLLSNAVKYTPEKGSISCNSTVKNGRLDFEVKNTGVGLTEEEQQNLFQRFYQTSEDNIGTGIGLALVKELVDLHKGTIEVTSAPSEWTSFSVTLPVDRNSYKNDMFVEAND